MRSVQFSSFLLATNFFLLRSFNLSKANRRTKKKNGLVKENSTEDEEIYKTFDLDKLLTDKISSSLIIIISYNLQVRDQEDFFFVIYLQRSRNIIFTKNRSRSNWHLARRPVSINPIQATKIELKARLIFCSGRSLLLDLYGSIRPNGSLRLFGSQIPGSDQFVIGNVRAKFSLIIRLSLSLKQFLIQAKKNISGKRRKKKWTIENYQTTTKQNKRTKRTKWGIPPIFDRHSRISQVGRERNFQR